MTDVNVSGLQREYDSLVKSGKLELLKRGIRFPQETIHVSLPAVKLPTPITTGRGKGRPTKAADNIRTMTFKLTKQNGDKLFYSAACPHCGKSGAIKVETTHHPRQGTIWPPEGGFETICIKCEDRLDSELEAVA